MGRDCMCRWHFIKARMNSRNSKLFEIKQRIHLKVRCCAQSEFIRFIFEIYDTATFLREHFVFPISVVLVLYIILMLCTQNVNNTTSMQSTSVERIYSRVYWLCGTNAAFVYTIRDTRITNGKKNMSLMYILVIVSSFARQYFSSLYIFFYLFHIALF